MAKLHELLAAEKTPLASWNTLFEDTLKKFGNAGHFFEGHSKSLKMIEDSPGTGVLVAEVFRECFGDFNGDTKNRLRRPLRLGLFTLDDRIPRGHRLYLGRVELPPLVEREDLIRRREAYGMSGEDQMRGHVPRQSIVSAAAAQPLRCRGPRSVFDLGRTA